MALKEGSPSINTIEAWLEVSYPNVTVDTKRLFIITCRNLSERGRGDLLGQEAILKVLLADSHEDPVVSAHKETNPGIFDDEGEYLANYIEQCGLSEILEGDTPRTKKVKTALNLERKEKLERLKGGGG